MKQIDKLITMLPNLDYTEFIGLARILKVPLVEEADLKAEKPEDRIKYRDFNDVLNDILDSFNKSNRQRKREILRVIKAATKKGEMKDDQA